MKTLSLPIALAFALVASACAIESVPQESVANNQSAMNGAQAPRPIIEFTEDWGDDPGAVFDYIEFYCAAHPDDAWCKSQRENPGLMPGCTKPGDCKEGVSYCAWNTKYGCFTCKCNPMGATH